MQTNVETLITDTSRLRIRLKSVAVHFRKCLLLNGFGSR